MAEDLVALVRAYIDRHPPSDEPLHTAIDGLAMMRIASPTGQMHTIYRPLVCLVLQGAKQVLAGDTQHQFAAGQSVIVGADIPVIGRVVQASRSAPYLAIAIGLDMAMLRDITAQMPLPEAATSASPSDRPDAVLMLEETGAGVIDCAKRLVRLLDRPDAIPVLHAAITRELHYWLLVGPHGAALRRLATQNGHTQRIARAIAVLRAEFAAPIAVARLADIAGMSPSSFHQHFKAVTSLSPLQFQKQLRLLEARRLMLTHHLPANRAAFAVGYESPTQFTREYARMFGAPPRRDVVEGRVG